MTADPAARAGAVLEIDLAGIVANWRLLAARPRPRVARRWSRPTPMVSAPRQWRARSPRRVAGSFSSRPSTKGSRSAQDLGATRRSRSSTARCRAPRGSSPRTADPGAERARPDRRLGAVAARPGSCRPCCMSTPAWRGSASRRANSPASPRHPPILCLARGDEPSRLRRPTGPPAERAQQRAASPPRAARCRGVPASLAASSGIFLGPAYHFDFVRPGLRSTASTRSRAAPTRCAKSFGSAARILQVREIDAGQSVGYGAAHVMDAPGRFATVAVGYADGWLRSLSHRGSGRIGGTRVPLLGRISMDLVIFDVSRRSTLRWRGPAGSSICWATITASMRRPPMPAPSATRS